MISVNPRTAQNCAVLGSCINPHVFPRNCHCGCRYHHQFRNGTQNDRLASAVIVLLHGIRRCRVGASVRASAGTSVCRLSSPLPGFSTSSPGTKPSVFRRRYYRLLEGAGIPSKGLHSLRHTFATNLVNGVKQSDGTVKTLTVKQVADLLGHSTTQVTEMYYV